MDLHARDWLSDLCVCGSRETLYAEGTYEAYLPLIEVKRAMVEVSEAVVLLADHSIFDKKSMSSSIPLEKISMIVTDDGITDTIQRQLSNMGKEIILAHV